MASRPRIRLPRQWSRHVKSGVLHAVSLASVALSYARGRATGRRRLRAQLEEATTEISLLREELSIKDGRWARSRSRRRPHYTPVQRMRILQLRAARGWTLEKTARVFLLDLQAGRRVRVGIYPAFCQGQRPRSGNMSTSSPPQPDHRNRRNRPIVPQQTPLATGISSRPRSRAHRGHGAPGPSRLVSSGSRAVRALGSVAIRGGFGQRPVSRDRSRRGERRRASR